MPKKEISFDEFLAKKRRAEATKKANEIMGRAARSSSSVTKRAKPTSTPGGNNSNRISKLSPTIARALQKNRLFAALHSDQVEITEAGATAGGKGGGGGGAGKGKAKGAQQAVSIKGTATPPAGSGFNIKGSSVANSTGPVVIQASNFAPGTTAEDIKYALEPLGKILSCIILTVAPTVIAEIVFERREAGEKCIATYNGQKADGRTLKVFYKSTPPIAPILSAAVPRDPFAEREEADRRRREQNIHFQDGRYGVKPPPMYSDALIQKGRGFAH